MKTSTEDSLSNGNGLSKACRSILPVCAHRIIAPGEVLNVSVRSDFTEFPERAIFGQKVSDYFEISEVSFHPWNRAPRVLQSRAVNNRTDVASINELLCRVIVPAFHELTLTVRNISGLSQKFEGVIVSRNSIVEQRERLLRGCTSTQRPRRYARRWWTTAHQRIVDLSEKEAKKIEAALKRCTDGSPRQNLACYYKIQYRAESTIPSTLRGVVKP